MKIELDLMEKVCRATDAMKCWLKHREHFVPVVEDERLKDVYCTWTSDQLYIQASGNADRLTVLFRALAWHGFHLNRLSNRPKEHQPEWTGLFKKNWTDAGGVEWLFTIYVQFTSTVCQRVQVGTEVKEVPVYKVVCGDWVQDSVVIEGDIPL